MIKTLNTIIDNNQSNLDDYGVEITEILTTLPKSRARKDGTKILGTLNDDTGQEYFYRIDKVRKNDQQYIFVRNNTKDLKVVAVIRFVEKSIFPELEFSNPIYLGGLIIDLSRNGINVAEVDYLWVTDELSEHRPKFLLR